MARKPHARAPIFRWVLVAFAVTFVAEWYGLLDLLELRTYDVRVRARAAVGAAESPLLALVAYDAPADRLFGPYPYPPAVYGALLDKLKDAGCLGVFLALRFPSEYSGAEAWRDVGIPVYVVRPYTETIETRRDRAPWVGGAEPLPAYVHGVHPVTSFSRLVPSPIDGVYRHGQAYVAYGLDRSVKHSLELLFAADALGVEANALDLHTDARGAVMIPPLPAGMPVLSVADVMQPHPPADVKAGLKGRWAVVGFDGIQDAGSVRTPFGPQTAFRVRASVINGVLTGGLTRPRSPLSIAAPFLAWVAVFMFVGGRLRGRPASAWTVAVCVACAIALHVAAAYLLMPGVWIPLVSPVAGMVSTGMAWTLSLNAARATLAERRALQVEREAAFGVMSAQVRHEVRNLLNSIRGPAEMVRTNFSRGDPLGMTGDHDALVAEMDVIVSRVTQLSDMVENELIYFHPNTFQLEPQDLWDIAMDARETLDDDLRAAKVTVAADAPPVRPTVMVDPAKMRVAFVNLIRNAVQAMPDGGEIGLEYGTVTAPRPGVFVRVSDTGVGIDADRLERLFEPFYTTKARGLGLGLFNVNHIVTTHSGQIRAYPAPGGGATFEVFLPVAAGVAS